MISKAIKLFVPLLFLVLLTTPIQAYAWTYGVSMTPTTTQYDAAEMPTSGLYWTTAPSGRAISFWVGASNTMTGFAQNGFAYNGEASNQCIAFGNGGSHSICGGHWGLWYEYCIVCTGASKVYYGDAVPVPSGWSTGDQISFSVATYTSKGEYSYLFKDGTHSSSTTVAVCNVSLSGVFGGAVGGLAENDSATGSTGWGNIYVDKIALWAEVISSGNRNEGAATVYDSSSLTAILLYNYTVNEEQLGFNTGTHYSGSSTLWTGSLGSTNENVPADLC